MLTTPPRVSKARLCLNSLKKKYSDFKAVGFKTYQPAPPYVKVMGHGVVAHDVAASGPGGAYTTYTYVFTYGDDVMKVRVSSHAEGWALGRLTLKSKVANYAPVVPDKSVTVPANPTSGGAGTIELRATDAECDATKTYITELPKDGRLYLCSCSNVW